MDRETQLALMAASIYPVYYKQIASQMGNTPFATKHAARASIEAAREIIAELQRPSSVR